jgi:hypothetical protein
MHACSPSVGIYTTTIILSTREREKRIFPVLSRTMPCVTHNTIFFFSNYVARTGNKRDKERERREKQEEEEESSSFVYA